MGTPRRKESLFWGTVRSGRSLDDNRGRRVGKKEGVFGVCRVGLQEQDDPPELMLTAMLPISFASSARARLSMG